MEHDDFMAGAENMEHRAMRLEAEREAHQEAMYAAMDLEDGVIRYAQGSPSKILSRMLT
jgi:hypothetical protein